MKVNKFIILFVFIFIILLLITCSFLLVNNYEDTEQKFLHISIDDTILIFSDLTMNRDKYTSIFDNLTLKFLKECHEQYGAKFSLYCFGNYSGINLSNCTDKFKDEFIQNSDWLKFGFHAYDNIKDYNTLTINETIADYNFVINELKRIVGEESLDTVIRMEKFICNKENVLALKNCENGIMGLLASDTLNRQNYYLDDQVNSYLYTNGYYFDSSISIFFYKTDLRIENVVNVYEEFMSLKNNKDLIVFTHEWNLNVDNMKKIKNILKFAEKNNFVFEFPKKVLI